MANAAGVILCPATSENGNPMRKSVSEGGRATGFSLAYAPYASGYENAQLQ
jgi:hypothetical protein